MYMRLDREFYLITGLSLTLTLFKKLLKTKPVKAIMGETIVSAKPLYYIKNLNAHICLVVIVYGKANKKRNTFREDCQRRFAILFVEGCGNMKSARRIADSVSSVLTVLSSDRSVEELGVVMLSERCLTNGLLNIARTDILENRGIPDDIFSREGLDLLRNIDTYTMLPNQVITKCFSCLPCVVASLDLFNACHFYRESLGNFEFVGDAITEVLQEPEGYPETKELQVKAETALHSAYKAIEAIVGEPGRNKRRNEQRLQEWGINPYKRVGFGSRRMPLLSKLLRLQQLRDSAVAHGKRTRGKPITYYEIMDAQYLAQAVILEAIDYQETNLNKQ